MKIVDHGARRREIAQAAVDVIAAEGLEAATFRRVAAALSVSTRSVTHYFADKDELLLWVYRHMAECGQAQLQEMVTRDPPDLVGGLLSMSAVEKLELWRVYVAFWDRAVRCPALAAEHERWFEATVLLIDTALRRSAASHADVPALSMRLVALVQGLSVQLLLGERLWARDQVEAILARELAVLTQPGPAPAPAGLAAAVRISSPGE